jgi:hypothetical protein
MKEFCYVPRLDIDNIGAFEDINEEDKRKGMDYVWKKRSLYYNNCLTLGPKYKIDREMANRIIGEIEKKVVDLYK